ncbi:MAG TPA: pyridoxal phosphate-dependent aminotransferase [Blastocatellia bacterium]
MTDYQPARSAFAESVYTADMGVSATIAVFSEAERLRAEGVDLVDLGAGEPDFPTPQNIKHAAQRAIEENMTRYTAVGGTAALKQAIIKMAARDFGAAYQPSQVIVTVGGKQGIFNAMASLLNPGDEVLIPSPYWVTFPEITTFLQARPVFVETASQQFVLTADAIRAAATPKTRLLLLNSPNNPSGRVIPPDEFKKIVETAAERGIWVISDECYVHFAYPPARPFSAASLPAELKSRVMVCGSFSKTYAMTGWRVGYSLGPQEWIQAMLKIQSHTTSNATSIAQQAAIEAAVGPQDSLRFMLGEYKRRRDWLIPALNEIPGMQCTMPEGAFYAFPNVQGLLNGAAKNSTGLAKLLLNEARVVVTPGSAFGADDYIRISYANSLDALKKGAQRMSELAGRIKAGQFR